MDREEAIEVLKKKAEYLESDKRFKAAVETLISELAESEDERIRKALVWHLKADVDFVSNGVTKAECLAYLEKQKENSKSADSIPSDCTSDAKCENRDSEYGVFPEDAIVVARACEKLEAHGYIELAHALINVNLYTKEQKPAEWSEEDERMLNLTKTQLRILQSHLSHTHSERMSDMEYSSQLLQIEKCVSWLDIRFKYLRPQPMNTIKIDELEDFIDTELHKDEFIRRWPQYAFNVPEHKEGDEYSVGVAVGVGRIINKLRNFIVNKKA